METYPVQVESTTALINLLNASQRNSHIMLTLKRPTFSYVNAHIKAPPKIHFIHLSNTESYWNLLKHDIISISFSTQCCLFQNIIFFCSHYAHVFINHVLKFKYLSGWIKGMRKTRGVRTSSPMINIPTIYR
jgi:hypothetical protein